MIDTFFEKVGDKKIDCTAKDLAYLAMAMRAGMELKGLVSEKEGHVALGFLFAVLDSYCGLTKEEFNEVLEDSKEAWEMTNKVTKGIKIKKKSCS